ncbi:GH25124 [Drosophila grimshawi]|uniref:Glycoprotein-N-acetylgalactosamine 3-beta-galactosyltransferase 1 n=2 Tax=Drosophila grimshawi TaxID=7222 RepID=B4JZE9_DROGR|nr:GH25124 [Drosophila grimshawi]
MFWRFKHIWGSRTLPLLASCLIWLVLLELYLFALSGAGIKLMDYLQPPYKENISDYVVGSRNQTLDNLSIAEQLYSSIRIHCLLQMTNDHEHRKLRHIRRTWGRRCNRMHLSQSVNPAGTYRRIYDRYSSDLDWLLHVHVDSYVIMENVRFHLASYAPNSRIYFSAFHLAYPYAHVSLRDTTDFIFSRGALKQLVAQDCVPNNNNLGGCLAAMQEGPNVYLFPFKVPAELVPFSLRSEFWNWPYIHRAIYSGLGFNISTDYPIAFPYVTANQLYVLEYFLYHLRPYGYMTGMPGLRQGSALQLATVPVNDTLSKQLYKQVRILCLVLTYPDMYAKVARAIRQTWGRHCNKLIVFSSRRQERREEAGMATVALNVSEGYSLLWGKAKAAFKHVYRHYLDEADWFFKADDDTYAIIDNMRYMLHPHQPDEAIYFGCKFTPDVKQGYMSGGAGYVLSREAVRRLVEDGLDSGRCNQNQMGTEDFEMGVCLSTCNVTAGDSRDAEGRHRFLPLSLEHMMIPGRMSNDFWLYEYMYYKLKEGLECCSTYAITIHYVLHYQMYLFDYLLYNMRPYGIIMGYEPLTGKLNSKRNFTRFQI